MNSLAAVTWKDMLEPHFFYLSESRKALITKVLAGCYGLLGIFFAFFFGTTDSNVMQVRRVWKLLDLKHPEVLFNFDF